MKTRRVASATRAGLTIGACLVGLVSLASAMTTSDQPASILMWPKVVVTESTDTLVDISNVSSDLVAAHCWLINANSHCASTSSKAGAPLRTLGRLSARGPGRLRGLRPRVVRNRL